VNFCAIVPDIEIDPVGESFTFATALILFCISLFLSLIELINSTRSLEIELSDMAGLEDSILDYLKKMIK
jgi:hypothetical protein